MSEAAIQAIAFYGPFVGKNPLTWQARLVLCCMAHGHETPTAICRASGLSAIETIDAIHELAQHYLVMWAFGRPWYHLGEHWRDRRGAALGE